MNTGEHAAFEKEETQIPAFPPRVSIVVPVYNVAAFVGRCFDSVAAQTFPNLECIFVDDCGSDTSMETVRERIANYRGNIDFKIVRHEKNRGLSAARNTGADAASGDYVYFLDSDDLLTPDCIALLAKPLQERRVDFVIGNYASGGEKACFIPMKISAGFLCENEKIRTAYLRGGWFMMAWNRLVKRDFLLRERLRFAEGLLHEDNLWSFQLACVAQTMCAVPEPTYVYAIRGNSITTAKSRKNLDSLVAIADELEKFSRKRGLEDDADVIRHIIGWRENLVFSARAYGNRLAWEIYKNSVRQNGFCPKKFRALRLPGKVRYLHHLLPAPAGFLYLHVVSKALALSAKPILRRFSKQ